MSFSQHRWIKKEKLRDKGAEDLRGEVRKLKANGFSNRFNLATGKLDNKREITLNRKRLAILMTLLREKELGISAGKGGK